jgi:general secretion pathway protein A
MSMLNHWQLRERPFEAIWDARYFYSSPSHREALSRLLYFIDEGSMNVAMLSGEIGCGKTLTRWVFAHHVNPMRYRLAMLENSGLTFSEIIEALLRRLTPPSTQLPNGRLAQFDMLNSLLEQNTALGRHVLLVIDEVQDMSPTALRELRSLTNFNVGGRSSISIILVGQPEIRKMVAAEPALDQRISLRYHLLPLAIQDLPNYLQHRLTIAGHPTGLLFSPDATHLLHAVSRGVPRDVNRLAKLSLEHAWACDDDHVSFENVQAVAHDLARHQEHNLVAV